MLRAEKEGITPEQLIANVQAEHSADFAEFLVDFDNFHSTHSEENRKLVHAMLNLAQNLNLQVVAEGVETRAQLALLRDFGCDQVQGFLISKPLPMPELIPFLTAAHTASVSSAAL